MSPSDIVIRPHGSRSAARTSALWIAPTTATGAAITFEWITHYIDARIIDAGIDVPGIFDRGGPDDIRALLTTIAGAAITTLALVLSLTMIALTLAAAQLGPRLVQQVLRLRASRVTTGVFTGLFAYSLLVLDSVSDRASSEMLPRIARSSFLPHIGATVVLLLALGAVGCLVWFLTGVAGAVQLSNVVESVVADLRRAEETLPGAAVPAQGPATRPSPELDAGVSLRVARAGYVQLIRHEPLVAAAVHHGASIELFIRPGEFVTTGQEIGRIRPVAVGAAIGRSCERHIDIGPNRTLDQDLEFAVDQLVEVALRALSPALNDTFTALGCLDWLAEALCSMEGLEVERATWSDSGGTVRLVQRPRRLAGIIGRAYEKIRQSAAGNPAVMIGLLQSITRVAAVITDAGAHGELAQQADDAVVSALAQTPSPLDGADLRAAYDACCSALDRDGVL